MASMQREKFETSYSNLIHFSIFLYKEKKHKNWKTGKWSKTDGK